MQQPSGRSSEPETPSYPPEPWELRATIHAALWRVTKAELPPLPVGLEPVRWFGRALVGAVWVVYRPGGVLAYNEVAAVVVTRRGLSVGVTVTEIWVDSAASAAGARALWAIPKELARFEVAESDGFAASAWDARDGRAIGSLRFEQAATLTQLPTLPLSVFQERAGTLLRTPARVRGTVQRGHATWSFDADGPLARWPTGEPLVSFRVDDAHVRFGAAR